ncbi:MAG: heat-inducible transcription repressor HrcA [Clostridia bacterium]|nr:heat-inducible transcription repressor HrcA [Clostridia bacterium]
MALSIRKQKILQALVARYIETAQPVSSSDIKDVIEEKISPATIRSELSALEEMGYLEQPHVSAGRIPTAKAYKLYVESLPQVAQGSRMDYVQELRNFFNSKMDEVEDVVRSTAKVLSDVTNYTSVVVVEDIADVVVKNIRLVDLGDNSALIVIVTNGGVVKDSIIDLPVNMGSEYLATASEIVNQLFDGKSVKDILLSQDNLSSELHQYRELLNSVIKLLETIQGAKSNNVIVEGTAKLLDYPEYEQSGNMKAILSLIDSKEKLGSIVTSGGIELSVKIGADEGVAHGSLVSLNYKIDDTKNIHAGIIGPERMDYKKVIEVLTHLEEAINTITDPEEE